jgi:pSer/pThr/pTyr-binding forkhead associated (FHA) protein
LDLDLGKSIFKSFTFAFENEKKEFSIGRSAKNFIALSDDPLMSNFHARIFIENGTLRIEDTQSTNKWFIDIDVG